MGQSRKIDHADPAADVDDRGHMSAALVLARRGLGLVAPNPAVGCVLVRDGRVVGRGLTGPGGRPHGETLALEQAGPAASGATAYVTLEPCAHQGQTGACARALIEAGIGRAVIAVEDPDPRVSGRGIEALRGAGVAVDVGLLGEQAARLNAGFFSRIRLGRPLFTLKTATTLDGRIATRTGDSQWITGAEARAFGHRLRATHDAILTGVGTLLADDPALTCRLPGLEGRAPIRVIADSRLRTPLDGNLMAAAGHRPTWIFTGAAPGSGENHRAAGADCIRVATAPDGRIDLLAMAATLGERGVTRVLVEAGGTLAASLLAAGLIDRIAWFRSGGVIGGDGLAAIGAIGVDRLTGQPRFAAAGGRPLGTDRVDFYEKQPNGEAA